MSDESLSVANAMMEYGGSFVSALGKALMSADHINVIKIKNAFPEDWGRYLKMGEDMK